MSSNGQPDSGWPILFISDWRQFSEVQELAFQISLNLKESLTLIPLAFLSGSWQDCKKRDQRAFQSLIL